MKIEQNKNTITITFNDEFSASNLADAMTRKQWVNFKGEGNILKLGEEPVLTDLDHIFNNTTCQNFQPNCELKQVSKEPDSERNTFDVEHSAIYIQSISGYSGNYEYKAKLLLGIGFEVLRSIKTPFTYSTYVNGKLEKVTRQQCWEIWYLPGSWSATGELKGKTNKEIVKWVWENIQPGNVECGSDKWALCMPD